MGEVSAIAWTRSTFNPWWVCTEVSPGCDHCYARDFSRRFGYEWGKDAPRLFFNERHWREPLRWNEKARKSGEPWRVFCGSMCDILDTWEGEPIFTGKGAQKYWHFLVPPQQLARDALRVARLELWNLIEATPCLTWMLLTKRPQDYERLLPTTWLAKPRPNVWLMTTVESPAYLWRVEALRRNAAVVHGISWEPALDYVDFKPFHDVPGLWVIGGGESGPHCRPFELEWARRVRNDCEAIGSPYFLKQLGGHPNKRDEPELWPEDLRVQEFPVGRAAMGTAGTK